MGVLTGAFGKLQMGSYYRNLQNQLMGVQSSLRKATRQVSNVNDMIERYQKSQNNGLTLNMYAQKQYGMSHFLATTGLGDFQNKNYSELSDVDKKKYTDAQTQYNQLMSNFESQLQMSMTQSKTQVEDYVQWLKDTVLAAAKDEEDYLQGKKDSLESQIKSVSEDYQACKKMEEQDWQMFKPNYTGGSNG